MERIKRPERDARGVSGHKSPRKIILPSFPSLTSVETLKTFTEANKVNEGEVSREISGKMSESSMRSGASLLWQAGRLQRAAGILPTELTFIVGLCLSRPGPENDGGLVAP